MSAPDVNTQVKAEAAKSLLERMGEKTRLVKFFRYNASAKHGVPIDDDTITIDTSNIKQVESKPAPTQSTSETKTEKSVVQPIVIDNQKKEDNSGNTTKGILMGLGGAAALAAAIWGGTQLAKPEPQPTTNINNEDYYESPYQYLEDIGEHLP